MLADTAAAAVGEDDDENVVHIILFYHYFATADQQLDDDEHELDDLLQWQQSLCAELGLVGRVLVSTQGLNGTLSGTTRRAIEAYKDEMRRWVHPKARGRAESNSGEAAVTPPPTTAAAAVVAASATWRQRRCKDATLLLLIREKMSYILRRSFTRPSRNMWPAPEPSMCTNVSACAAMSSSSTHAMSGRRVDWSR